jgi:hypothetical protein
MKKFLLTCAVLVSGYATADVGSGTLWDPAAARTDELYQVATQAKAIQEKLGAEVSIATDQDGNMHFFAAFDNWESWGKFQAKLAANADWQALVAKFEADPPAVQGQTFYINTPVVAKPNNVSVVFAWDVQPGRTPDMIANAQEAAGIHAKLGASAGINIDDLGDLYYELTFDSWEAWGKYTTAVQSSEEWAAFIAKVSQDPVAELVKVYRLDTFNGE